MAKNKAMATTCDDKWQIESDLRTLAEAAKIRADPKRLEAVKKLAQEQMVAMAAVAGADKTDD